MLKSNSKFTSNLPLLVMFQFLLKTERLITLLYS